jgi:hypothetical protein
MMSSLQARLKESEGFFFPWKTMENTPANGYLLSRDDIIPAKDKAALRSKNDNALEGTHVIWLSY